MIRFSADGTGKGIQWFDVPHPKGQQDKKPKA
jgi:hypothetical protein